MELDRVTIWRNLTGKAGAAFCVIFLLAALDGLVGGFREPDDTVRLLAGESVKVNGSLREDVGTIANLRYVSSSELIQLTFETLHAGFWLGGYMWRGLLTVSPHIGAGEYSLKVTTANGDPSKPARIFLIKVYRNQETFRKNDKSLIRRYLAVSPWYVFGTSFPLTCVCFALVYLFSQQRAVLLAQKGIAEVYLVEEGEDGCRIAFGLGTDYGVQSGSELTIFNQNGIAVGSAKVEESSRTDSTAVVKSDWKITLGCVVSLHHHLDPRATA